MEENKTAKRIIYEGDLIIFSAFGIVLISFGLLLYYYKFVSKATEPPFLLKMLFEMCSASIMSLSTESLTVRLTLKEST